MIIAMMKRILHMRIAPLGKAIGPGILVACAAVGGSHLVWSTRAGAQFGWSLLWLILLTNVLKMPFFLFGQRYTAATGESLLEGYRRHGIVYVWIFLVFNILTGVVNIAGVAMLSGALLAGYGLEAVGAPTLTLILLGVCAALLLVGHYRLLDSFAKVIVAALGISTVIAVVFASLNRPAIPADFIAPSPYTWASLAFMISLLGWMPAPIDLSAWSSLWMFSRKEQTGHFATVRESAVDFYLGYVSTTVLAVLFTALGALVMFGTEAQFSASGIGFAQQLVNLYTATIGSWSHLLILTAAFTTMFSTTITCLDGYPRSLAACCVLIGKMPSRRYAQITQAWIAVSTVLAAICVRYFAQNLVQFLSLAAIFSFLTSPVLALINLKVMNGSNVPERYRPGLFLNGMSVLGLLFFAVMTIGYVYTLIWR